MITSVMPSSIPTENSKTQNAGQGTKERSALTRMLEKSRDEQYNVFMKMFLAQVKHQDPDNPMSTHEMTQSVMSFFSAAEQAQTNKLLKQSNDMHLKQQMAAAKTYLNKEIVYEGNGMQFEGTPEDIQLMMPAGITEAELVILDENLQRVKTIPLTTDPGLKNIQWLGNSDLNPDRQVPPGVYYTRVTAIDEKKNLAEIPTMLKGTVRQISYQDDEGEFLLLVKDNMGVRIDDLIAVRKPPSQELISLGENMQEQIKQYGELHHFLKDYIQKDSPVSLIPAQKEYHSSVPVPIQQEAQLSTPIPVNQESEISTSNQDNIN